MNRKFIVAGLVAIVIVVVAKHHKTAPGLKKAAARRLLRATAPPGDLADATKWGFGQPPKRYGCVVPDVDARPADVGNIETGRYIDALVDYINHGTVNYQLSASGRTALAWLKENGIVAFDVRWPGSKTEPGSYRYYVTPPRCLTDLTVVRYAFLG